MTDFFLESKSAQVDNSVFCKQPHVLGAFHSTQTTVTGLMRYGG